MHKRTAELIKYGRPLGYANEGLDGGGHYLLRHSNGEVVKVASSPGDLRGDANCRAEMRRKAGADHDGPNSGKYRRGVSRADVRAPAPIVATNDRARALREYIANCERQPVLDELVKRGLRNARRELSDLNEQAQQAVHG